MIGRLWAWTKEEVHAKTQRRQREKAAFLDYLSERLRNGNSGPVVQIGVEDPRMLYAITEGGTRFKTCKLDVLESHVVTDWAPYFRKFLEKRTE